MTPQADSVFSVCRHCGALAPKRLLSCPGCGRKVRPDKGALSEVFWTAVVCLAIGVTAILAMLVF